MSYALKILSVARHIVSESVAAPLAGLQAVVVENGKTMPWAASTSNAKGLKPFWNERLKEKYAQLPLP